MMAAQRGNVTLITAFTAMLMVLVVILGAGLSNTAGDATRMQASSDQAALTAAETYISVVNDEVAFDLIDWGLGFLSRMAEVVQTIGEAIGAVPFLEWLGAAIVAVGEFVQTAADSAKDVFDGIKDTLNSILDEAKSILAIINATVAAGNNGYLGFILPSDILNQAASAKYTPKDIQDFVDHQLQPTKNAALFNTVKAQAMHSIWGAGVQTKPATSCTNQDGTPCKVPNCGDVKGTGQYCGGQKEERSPGHDSFNLWPDTTGCTEPPLWTDVAQKKPVITAPQWHRPCNEKEWLRDQLRTFYLDAEKSIRDTRLRINFNVPDNSPKSNSNPNGYDSARPTLFDDGGDKQKQKDAWDAMVKAEAALDDAAKGGGSDPNKFVNAATDQLAGYYETAPLTFGGLPDFRDPFGSFGPRPFCGHGGMAASHPVFLCNNNFSDGGMDNCHVPAKPANATANSPGSFTDEELNPCQNFWGLNVDNGKKDQMQFRRPTPLPANYPIDYRKTNYYADDMSGAKGLSDWKGYKLVPHSAGNVADNSNDVNEAFIMLNHVNPTDTDRFIRQFSGDPPPQSHWTVTGSKAIIHRAESSKDAVHAISLCNSFSDHDDSKLLGFIPKTAYGWCKVLLGAFDVFKAIYDAIHDFFYDNFINPLRGFSIDIPLIGNICPFCWLADIIAGFVDFVLGPAPPDTRTYHVALVTVGCVPAIQAVADIANNFSLEKILKLVIARDPSLGDANNATCSGPSGGGGGSSGLRPVHPRAVAA